MQPDVLVLHFGVQCPWQPWVVEQARQAAQELGAHLGVVDVAHQPEVAGQYKLFFPFMTVVGATHRLPSPTTALELVRLAEEGPEPRATRCATVTAAAEAEAVLPLTPDRIADTCGLCVPSGHSFGCKAKVAWAEEMAQRLPDGILGLAAYEDKRLVGAVEFLPGRLVPYPLPDKSPRDAFITCVYSDEAGPDYRGQLLRALLSHLRAANYERVLVVAGQRTAYPNGPESFLRRHGFVRLLELGSATLREGVERLVLLGQVLG